MAQAHRRSRKAEPDDDGPRVFPVHFNAEHGALLDRYAPEGISRSGFIRYCVVKELKRLRAQEQRLRRAS